VTPVPPGGPSSGRRERSGMPRESVTNGGFGEMSGNGEKIGCRKESDRGYGPVEDVTASSSRARHDMCARTRRGTGAAAPPRARGVMD